MNLVEGSMPEREMPDTKEKLEEDITLQISTDAKIYESLKKDNSSENDLIPMKVTESPNLGSPAKENQLVIS